MRITVTPEELAVGDVLIFPHPDMPRATIVRVVPTWYGASISYTDGEHKYVSAFFNKQYKMSGRTGTWEIERKI